MPIKRCPNCNLWNSENTRMCDCGYDFMADNGELFVDKNRSNLETFSILIAFVSVLMLIPIVFAIINIEAGTSYYPDHINEQKQHARMPMMLLLSVLPFLSITGILLGRNTKYRKSERYNAALIGRIVNSIILLFTVIIIIIEVYLSLYPTS